MTELIARILVVDDEEDMCLLLSQLIKREGFDVLVASNGEKALKMVYTEVPDTMLLDIKMPDLDGMEVLKRARELDPELPIIVLTAFACVPGAVQAIKWGAYGYLAKPFNNHEVVSLVHRAIEERNLKKRLHYCANEFEQDNPLRVLMGPSDAIRRLTSEVNRVAKTDFNVVILGETGSGKELVARAIYRSSFRYKTPFVPVDCGAIPETLFESELFGYEKGAFTGADQRRQGKYEIANGGILFLDEITNMPLGSQAKLLRVLQEKVIYRVGGIKPVKVDVRVLAASNQDLESEVIAGSYREDLFFRLNEFTIRIPSLRDRREDILYLAKQVLDISNVELKKDVKGFTEEAIEALLGYNWPGNVRQLQSTIRRAVLLADEIIDEKHLEMKRAAVPGLAFTPKIQGIPWKDLSLKEIVCQSKIAVEREVLLKVLRYTGGNKAKAARLLKIDYKTIHTKVKQFGISIMGGDYEEEKQRAWPATPG